MHPTPPLRHFGFWSTSCLCLAVTLGCQGETTEPAASSPQISEAAPAASDDDAVASETNTTGQGTEDQEGVPMADKSGKVLRHAVFFAMKETSSSEDIERVVDAFAALPSKIDAITGFQWGTNNSPEGFDDGFTHCFLLSFRDEEGRDVYLPHPAHKEFGNVLRPHMKDVFVIDYWGSQGETEVDKQLKHAVFFKFKDDAAAEDIKKVEDAFAELPSKIDAIKAFEWGKNNSPEKHDDGFTHCFMVTFDSEEGRAQYLPHPDHESFVEVLKPVLDKVRVLDFWDEMKK